VREGRAVLNKLRENIRECRQHAEDCARSAKAASGLELREDYLVLEQHWLVLARHYLYTLHEAAASHERNSLRRAAPPVSPFSDGKQP
jgi:hypothetical protein